MGDIVTNNTAGNNALALFVAAYAAALVYLGATGALPFEESGMILAVIGIGFSALSWILTLGIKPIQITISRPAGEAIAAMLLVLAIAAYLVYGRTWVDGLVPDSAHGGSDFAHEAAQLASKLTAFVIIPLIIFRVAFGQGLASFGLSRAAFARLAGRDGLAALVIGAAICVFQFYVGNAAAPIRNGEIAGTALWLGGAMTFLWLVIEVGLVEEFFFRGLVQTRLAAAFRSEIAGLFLMALIFGLIHAPGMVLRGAGGAEGLGEGVDPLTAMAYVIAIQSVAALFLGIVWMRTHSLPAVMIIHAATDLFPAMPSFTKALGLA
jgi:membrane protease YdiL (CAAX protease family)